MMFSGHGVPAHAPYRTLHGEAWRRKHREIAGRPSLNAERRMNSKLDGEYQKPSLLMLPMCTVMRIRTRSAAALLAARHLLRFFATAGRLRRNGLCCAFLHADSTSPFRPLLPEPAWHYTMESGSVDGMRQVGLDRLFPHCCREGSYTRIEVADI